MMSIDWDKLQPYSGDNKKSFEELCYQIVSEKFKNDISNGAVLTPVDDSGGGDGVEFYLTLGNEDVYGWQAKFFCRLNESGRKEQIKKSLQTAHKKHPNLKKWFFCNKCDFTPDEKKWFDNELSNAQKNGERVLPKKHTIQLLNWGKSELLDYLRQYPSIHKFFFSEKLLTQEWFDARYKSDIKKSQIKAKYESQIHISTNIIDDAINKILGGNRLAKLLEKEMETQQLRFQAEEYKDAFVKLFSEDVKNEYKSIQTEFRKLLSDKKKIIDRGISQLLKIKNLIISKNEKELQDNIEEFKNHITTLKKIFLQYSDLTISDLCKPIEYLRDQHEQSPKKSEEIKSKNNKRRAAREILFGPYYKLAEYAIHSLENCLEVFELLDKNEYYLSGEAGMGKTHVSFNIYEDQIRNQQQPAIFVFAKDISNNQSLEGQLKDNFDIPVDWSFDDFLGVLEITGKINKTKIPIIIDGLNESIDWDSVWKNGLENLIIKIKNHPHIVLITTYRTSYEDQLFPEQYFKNAKRWKLKGKVLGFKYITNEAVKTYLQFYKIKLDNFSNAIRSFENPLYLKIFCETKNPERREEIGVSFQNENLFEVFDEYIEKSNNNITNSLKELYSRYNTDFTKNKLLQLSKYIWKNNSRGISCSADLFTNEELSIFEGENLLIFRDWNKEQNNEEIQFTYDLLGGYFISKYLIEKYKKLVNHKPLLKFAESEEFRKKLLDQKTKHPLFNDILRTICILFIKESEIFLFDILKNDKAKKYSTESLFEINTQYIKTNETLIKTFLKKEFLKKNNKTYLFRLAQNVELDSEHPLNFNFWSDLLNDLSMCERDLSWSEYIRTDYLLYKTSDFENSYFENYINNFENACKTNKKLPNRVHFAAKKVMWVLTTTIRKLRDEATRGLYYYALEILFLKRFL